MNIIRAFVQILTTIANYRRYTSIGRPGEVVTGKFYQHYGYMSYPPKGLAHVTVTYGNNAVSVAENSGANETVILPGDVIIFTDPNDAGTGTSSIFMSAPLSDQGGKPAMQIYSDGVITITTPKSQIEYSANGKVQITNDGGGSLVMDENSGQVSLNSGNLTVDV